MPLALDVRSRSCPLRGDARERRLGYDSFVSRLRYNVAASLDGYVAGPQGEYDWITMDASIDFPALFAEFDRLVMGRKTFETVLSQGADNPTTGMDVTVFSRTLRGEDHPDVKIVSSAPAQAVSAMKRAPGKDIWLFGGGALFRTLLDAGLVDTIEVALMPIVLGDGIPLVARGARSAGLRLASSKTLASGVVMLTYDAQPSTPPGLQPDPRAGS
jgi:dihydrofolate reductase